MTFGSRHLDNWLAAIIRSANDGIIGKTPEGIIISWNPAAERIYGYMADESIGRNISFLAPPDRKDEIPEILARINQGERIEHFETVRVSKDGRHVNVSLTISPVANEAGQIIGASVIVRDVTAAKRLREALTSSEALAARVLQQSPVATLLINQDDQTILDADEAFIALAGYNRDELVGASISSLELLDVHTEKQLIVRLRSGKAKPPVATIVHGREAELPVLAASEPIRMGGRPYMMLIFIETSDAGRASELLLESMRAMVREFNDLARSLGQLYRQV
jgi:PAS domain S-box-containing protein